MVNDNPDAYTYERTLNYFNNKNESGVEYFFKDSEGSLWGQRCPYGQVGDVLWVRESCLWVMLDHAHDLLEGAKDRTQWVYKASVHSDFIKYAKERYGYKWKPSIHMPKDACRIFLEITNIRVERLNDIKILDALREGMISMEYKGYPSWTHNIEKYPNGFSTPIGCFSHLWNSINGPETWEVNPWVWVIEFKRIEKPSNFFQS